MRVYKKDVKLSLWLAEQAKEIVKPNTCYDNIWHLYCNNYGDVWSHSNWDISYGLIHFNVEDKKLYAKHAFLLNLDNEKIIDPTSPADDGKEYVIVFQLAHTEYLNAAAKYMTVDPFDNKIFRQKYMDFMVKNRNIIVVG